LLEVHIFSHGGGRDAEEEKIKKELARQKMDRRWMELPNNRL
jgi:hypothetical protein